MLGTKVAVWQTSMMVTGFPRINIEGNHTSEAFHCHVGLPESRIELESLPYFFLWLAATKHRIISGLQYHSEMSDAVLDTMSMCIHRYIGLLICSHSFTFHAASSSTFPRRSCETLAQERTAASAKFGASMLIVGSYQNSQFFGLKFPPVIPPDTQLIQ